MIHSKGQHSMRAQKTQATIRCVPWNLSSQIHSQSHAAGPQNNQKKVQRIKAFFSLLCWRQDYSTVFALTPVLQRAMEGQSNKIRDVSQRPHRGLEILLSKLQKLSLLATATEASQCLWQGGRWLECELGLGKETRSQKASRQEAPEQPPAKRVCPQAAWETAVMLSTRRRIR